MVLMYIIKKLMMLLPVPVPYCLIIMANIVHFVLILVFIILNYYLSKYSYEILYLSHFIMFHLPTNGIFLVFILFSKYIPFHFILGACKKFDKHFLLSNSVFVEKAKLYYISGHMLPGKYAFCVCVCVYLFTFEENFVFFLFVDI